MSGREAVLARIRGAARGAVPHPGSHRPPALPGGWETFARVLRAVGGEPHGPVGKPQLAETVAALARSRAGGGRVACVPAAAVQLGRGPWEEVPAEADPEGLEDISVAILEGALGVAECAAVALEGRTCAPRALPFLCRHLVLLLPTDAVVPDLHGAFARVSANQLAYHHLTWVSGPSKTADIEQTLVYGAHGPLTLDVVGLTT